MRKLNIKYLIEYVDLTEESPKATVELISEKDLKNILDCEMFGLTHVNYYMEVK